MPTHVSVEVNGPVAQVTLDRPDKLNGLTLEMLGELRGAARSLARDRSLRAVVLKGAGESFCAGLDFAQATKQPARIARLFTPNPLRGTNGFQEACWAWRRVPVPVIAEIHGHCYGGGVQLALAADFRFTTPDAEWSVLEGKWGLIPDMSGIKSLGELVGIDTAKRLTMTAEMFSGSHAHEIGLASGVADDPSTLTADLVGQLLPRSPDALAAGKRAFNKSWGAGARTTFRQERRRQLGVLLGKNARIALAASLKKQPPDYQPRGRWS
jgi:enoyl-CoA hydratase/carnithine racemase